MRGSPRSTMRSPVGATATPPRPASTLPRERFMTSQGPDTRSSSVRSVALRRRYNRSFTESVRWRQEKLNTLRDLIRGSPVEKMTVRLTELELKQVDSGGSGGGGGGADEDWEEGFEGHAQQDHVALVHGGAKDVMTKVLEARDMRDRWSLLEYAAVMGRGDHVRELARWLWWKLGVGGLVKQLREPGVDGAPLLFHAATNVGCLRDVMKIIVDTIGLGGLMHQVQATDQNGHTLLMYAARYADPEAFTLSLRLVRDLLDEGDRRRCNRQLTLATLGADEGKTEPAESLLMYAARYATVDVFLEAFNLAKKLLGADKVANYCEGKDSEDRTLLHYAAEARNDDMLPQVKSKLQGLEVLNDPNRPDIWKRLKQGVDKQGRTPAMCLLGRQGRSSELRANELEDSKEGASEDTKDEAKTAATAGITINSQPTAGVNTPGGSNPNESGTTQQTSMEQNLDTLLSHDSILTQPQTIPGTETHEGLSGIMHAARGGRGAFELACRKIKNTNGNRSTTPIPLFEMLGVDSESGEREQHFKDLLEKWTEETKEGEEEEKYKGRCANLIAQSALGGDESVLEKIGKAMEDDMYSSAEHKERVLKMWAKKTDYPMNSSDLFHATRQDRPQGIGRGYESRDMGASVYPGKDVGLKASLLSLTVLSGKKGAINWAAKFVRDNNASHEAKEVLRGAGGISPLAYATWTSCDTELFNVVCNALVKDDDTAKEETFLRPDILGEDHGLTPLAGALFRGDASLVEAVLKACGKKPLTHDEINSAVVGNAFRDGHALYEIQRILWLSERTITKDILAVLQKKLKNEKAVRSAECPIMSTRVGFNEAIEEAHPAGAVTRAQKASEGGTYDGLMALIEKGWDCLGYLPEIISRIEHHEAGVISTVLATVENARTTRQRGISNPFVVSAIASSHMADALKKRPSDGHSLKKLQRKIDTFTIELLSRLPSTVRCVGLELMGSFGVQKSSRQDMAILVGYIAVRWMLEPSLTCGQTDCARSGGLQPDPLQQALNRGPKAYEFVNTPLVLNYMQLKWSCTIPRWARRYPPDDNINEGFSTYGVTIHGKQEEKTWADNLLRFLQGWEPAREDASLMGDFPHTTVLPSLQFSMAGILGRPHEFFLVPSTRFIYEAFGYLFMLGLYCSCVSIAEVGVIPSNEITFYVFALGLLWREILEFRDVMPVGPTAFEGEKPCDTAHNRLTTGVHKYFSQDNWNILDTAAIAFIMVAFFFRLLAFGLHQDPDLLASTYVGSDVFYEEAFFVARLFLAMVAPLLFARVLSLAQVEKYLGPMTQIIWAMLFHLARFSLFMLVVMVSFALAFFSLYGSCEGDLSSAYGSMGQSLLAMFTAMLGDPDFDVFDEYDPNACRGPPWKYDAGIALLVVYMVTMSILMLNLLIAVLGTVHDTVHGRSELEFQLARNQFIQRGAGVVQNGRLPPPLNLAIEALLIVVDMVGLVRNLCRLAHAVCRRAHAASHAAWHAVHPPTPRVRDDPDASRRYNSGRGHLANGAASGGPREPWTTKYPPLSEKRTVIVLQGGLERVLFAFTMGLLALSGTAVLWVVSLPAVASRIVRWTVSAKGTHLRSKVAFLQAGHARPMFLAVLRLIGFLIGLFAAAILCFFCVLGSVVLWVRGLYAVVGWWRDSLASEEKQPDGGFGEGNVMAGTSGVDGGSWKAAMDIVETSNCSWNGPKGEEVGKKLTKHFDVELLLNLTTGWRLSHISSLVRRKEEARGMEKKMHKEIDDEQRGIGNVTAGVATTTKGKDGQEEPTGKASRVNSYSNDTSARFGRVDEGRETT